jgi:hypothetical protein
MRPRISSAAEIFIRPLQCFAAEILPVGNTGIRVYWGPGGYRRTLCKKSSAKCANRKLSTLLRAMHWQKNIFAWSKNLRFSAQTSGPPCTLNCEFFDKLI